MRRRDSEKTEHLETVCIGKGIKIENGEVTEVLVFFPVYHAERRNARELYEEARREYLGCQGLN
ncbi:MAG: hypothetical protein PHH00_01615 [Candidatus Nanoarchaeia archaeon]|nr:hypothetical protein [Candidatus Nanoarchaeia archaeon]